MAGISGGVNVQLSFREAVKALDRMTRPKGRDPERMGRHFSRAQANRLREIGDRLDHYIDRYEEG